MYFKAVIFDLDGTLLDTLFDLKNAVNYTLSAHGYKERTLEEIKNAIGNGIRNLVKKSLPFDVQDNDPLVDECTLEMKNYYFDNCTNDTCIYDGISDVLTFLNENNILASVLSNKADFLTKKIILHYFDDYFKFVYGERDGLPRKPDPTSVLLLAEEMGVMPPEILFVGDSASDILVAKNAGMVSLGVSWGYRDKKELIAAGADFVADAPDDIINFISTYKPQII